MIRNMCKSKIHRATVTHANINYQGSITIDGALMQAADLQEYEQVHVLNITNGQRIVTYVISGETNSGIICLNGPAARNAVVGDSVIIISYAQYQANELINYQPKLVMVNQQNQIIHHKQTASV